MRAKIIYEKESILVVYKPAGLATQTERIGQPDLVSELKNYLGSSYLGVVHRLDQPVEGLLVFGKTKEATAELAKQLASNKLKKRYLAVVCGDLGLSNDHSVVEQADYLYKAGDNCARILSAGDTEAIRRVNAKKAVLRYQVRNTFHPLGIMLLDVEIDTGRFHQIRAQLSHAGLPILGDEKYGTELSKHVSRELGVNNVALCADRLNFPHPAGKKELSFQIEPENPAFKTFP